MANLYEINLETFSKRLKSFYSNWNANKSELWGDSDVVAIATPPPSEDLRYLKSSAFNIWLLGYEFPETIMVFTTKHIHFLCSHMRASLLEVLKNPAKDAVGVDVLMHIKERNEDGSSQMDAILSDIDEGLVVGYLAKEGSEGKLLETWLEKLENLKLTDITNGLSDLFAVKDSMELKNVKKAAFLSASTMKSYVFPKMEEAIVEGKKVSHSALMDETEDVIMEPSKIRVKLNSNNVDVCYPPIFQSGGKFDLNLNPSMSSNDDDLCYDSGSVIICAVGCRYKNYCSNVARTFLIDANVMQSKAYEVLLKAHEAAIFALKHGSKVCDVYKAALAVMERDAPEFVGNMTESVGNGIGLELRELGFELNARNEKVLKNGMVFNVSLGFQNLETETRNSESQNFAMLLADTVIVGENGPEIATSMSSKDVNDVAYPFNA